VKGAKMVVVVVLEVGWWAVAIGDKYLHPPFIVAVLEGFKVKKKR
jgi:hypothetical protein